MVPGPISFLIFSETLKKGWKGGIATSLGPEVADALVAIPLAFVLKEVITSSIVHIVLGYTGGVFLIWLGYVTIKATSLKQPSLSLTTSCESGSCFDSFRKSFLIHALSPYSYGFWITAGNALLLKGVQHSLPAGIIVLTGFFSGTLSFECLLVFFTSKGKTHLDQSAYKFLQKICGICLSSFGFYLIVEAFKILMYPSINGLNIEIIRSMMLFLNSATPS